MNNSSNDLNDVIRRIVDEELLLLLDSKDVATFNRLYLERNATSLRHLISGREASRHENFIFDDETPFLR